MRGERTFHSLLVVLLIVSLLLLAYGAAYLALLRTDDFLTRLTITNDVVVQDRMPLYRLPYVGGFFAPAHQIDRWWRRDLWEPPAITQMQPSF